ncbi:hypothetical protein D3C81_1889630 [compost metagenome]
MLAWFQGLPRSAASQARARLGVAAMPPKAMRTPLTTSFSMLRLNAAHTAEMSSSSRLDTL